MKIIKRFTIFLLVILLALVCVIPSLSVPALQRLVFPVIGPSSYIDDFYASRGSFGQHNATDIITGKMQPVVAATDGVVYYVNYPQPSWGYSVGIRDDAGYMYNYLHLNDDNAYTNDGQGGPMRAYAAYMQPGKRVVAGQLLGWTGDSGHANNIPHLHFELHTPDDTPVNPFPHLNDAWRIQSPVTPSGYPDELLPYGTDFSGGLNIEAGNFDADPASEIVTGAGFGGGPHIRTFDTNSVAIGGGFYAYDSAFKGGADVAAGDVDGDGIDEIITGAGPGGGPHVKIFKANGVEMGGFYAYSASFPGGVRVAAGDVDGDGIDEIITGAASQGGPHVRIFESNGVEKTGFYAYAADFNGGVDVAAGDVDGDGVDEVVTTPGPGGGPHLRIFEGNGVAAGSFFAYGGSFSGGVKVSVGNVRTGTAKEEIMVAPWANGGPHIRMFNNTGTVLNERLFIEQWWNGFHEVAAGNGMSWSGTSTNRRASLWAGLE